MVTYARRSNSSIFHFQEVQRIDKTFNKNRKRICSLIDFIPFSILHEKVEKTKYKRYSCEVESVYRTSFIVILFHAHSALIEMLISLYTKTSDKLRIPAQQL